MTLHIPSGQDTPEEWLRMTPRATGLLSAPTWRREGCTTLPLSWTTNSTSSVDVQSTATTSLRIWTILSATTQRQTHGHQRGLCRIMFLTMALLLWRVCLRHGRNHSSGLQQYIAEGANWSISHLYWCVSFMFLSLPVPLSKITQFYSRPALYHKIALVMFKF